MKIKILHIVQSLEPGGLENGVVNLINEMDNNRFAVHVYCVRKIGAFQSRIKNKETKVILGKYSGSNLKICLEIRKYCKEMDIDIVHTHGWGTFFVGVIGAAIACVPVKINGEHGTLYYETYKRRFIQWLLFNWVDLNLSVSNDLKNKIVNAFHVKKSKIYPIINGVDLDRFRINEELSLKKRNELGIDNDSFVIGSVGRLEPVKDFSTLIKAFSELRKGQKQKNILLLLVGDGAEYSKLKNLSIELKIADKVIMPGMRNDIPELLSVLDVFVLPSESEGLSNTILEAMAAGKPVLATNVGGNPELIKHRETGILFPFMDYKTLSDELASIINDSDLRMKYVSSTLERVNREFSINTMIKNYETIYKKLLSEKTC